MKNNLFTFKDNKLLCWRLGPINAQKQVHFSKNVETVAGMGTHKPPISRGMWAFPYPHYDYFFCFHQWKKHLPKRFLDESVVKSPEDCAKYEKLLKEIQKKFKPSTFYTDCFYSHVFPNGNCDYDNWFYWDSPRDWAKIAQKTLISYCNWGNGLYVSGTTKNHLEIFVP